jgi:hypothetical protein
MRESRCISLLPRTTLHSDSEQSQIRLSGVLTAPVHSTQGVIDSQVYYQGVKNSTPQWIHHRGVETPGAFMSRLPGIFTTRESFLQFWVVLRACMAFIGTISEKSNRGWLLLPIGKKPMVEKFTSLSPSNRLPGVNTPWSHFQRWITPRIFFINTKITTHGVY